ncbi:winged helix-turn-helix domain-containing protein [Nesterenkonia sp. CF4.4]|uniref:winged helix-turn-helix domain-containing protein n=1 Tax=Nesterenkonia sp. CF4.4 TaxID=3373079 RepID=UPI003EE6C5FE
MHSNNPRQLTLRVPVVSRRPRHIPDAETPVPEVEVQLDLERREVHLGGAPVRLTPIEFELLAALLSEPGAALSRRELINRIWGHDWSADRHLVDVHIGNLRRKLGDEPAYPQFIHTVRGIGYRTGKKE